MSTIARMFARKGVILNLRNPLVCANRSHHHSNNFYAAPRFSTLSDKNYKGGATTPGKLSEQIRSGEKDNTTAPEGSQGGYGGSGISGTVNEGTPATKSREEKAGERRREDAARDTAASVAEMAKAGVVGAMETGLNLGEMAKKTMDGMWDAARKTTENVRDAVADDSYDGGSDRRRGFDKGVEDRAASDKHVEDLRRKARGCDLNKGY